MDEIISVNNNQQVMKNFGYNIPQGLYNLKQEYNVEKVKILIDSDKLAPFYEGLSEYTDNPFPEDKNNNNNIKNVNNENEKNKYKKINSNEISINVEEINKKSNSINNKKKENNTEKEILSSSVVIEIDKINNVNTCKKNIQNKNDMANNEKTQIPEMILTKENIYKYPIQCPICFLYYPRNINYTKCCDQPICTECFTQVKRNIDKNKPIKSKCTNCPYCSQENFGIYYLSPESKDYKEQYETFVRAKELNEKEYQDLFKDETFQGKKKKDLKTLTEDEIITSENIYKEWVNEKTEKQRLEREREERLINQRREEDATKFYVAVGIIAIIGYCIYFFANGIGEHNE